MFAALMMSAVLTPTADIDEVEKAKAAVAVEIAKLKLQPRPSAPEPSLRAIGTREFWNGFGWVEWSGTGWVQVAGAAEVAPNRPFPVGITRDTIAPRAVVRNSSFLDGTVTAPTTIRVLPAGRFGSTNCSSVG